MVIIHISGAPGAGKTFMGRKLKTLLPVAAKVVIRDLDDMFRDFCSSPAGTPFSPKKYQTYINQFIASHTNRPIIFVGLNKEHMTDTMYNVAATHKYYIDAPTDVIIEQHFCREIAAWSKWLHERDKHVLFGQLAADEKQVIQELMAGFNGVLRISKQRRFIKSFAAIYRKHQYEFLPYADIIKAVKAIIAKTTGK